MNMLERNHTEIPLTRQCQLFSVPRSSAYYRPKESALNLQLMHRLDQLFTAHPLGTYIL